MQNQKAIPIYPIDEVDDSKELHTCPYLEDIHGDSQTLCDCDEDAMYECAMDI